MLYDQRLFSQYTLDAQTQLSVVSTSIDKRKEKKKKKDEKNSEIYSACCRFLQTPNTIVGRFLITKFLK